MDALSAYTASFKKSVPSPSHMGRRCRAQPLPWSPSSACSPPSSACTPGANYPPGVGSCGPSAVAGDEGGVVLGALEAVQLASPESGLGWAGGRHMQPLLHLDAGGTQAQLVRWVLSCGRDPAGRHGAEDASLCRASPSSGLTTLLAVSKPEGRGLSAGHAMSLSPPQGHL